MPFAASESGGYEKLKSIGTDNLKVVEEMMVSGQPARLAVIKIQSEWGLLKEMRPETLKKMIERWRKNEVKQHLADRVKSVVTSMPMPKLNSQLNAMDEMRELAVLQKRRVAKLIEQENLMKGGIIKQAGEEIRLFNTILKDLASLQLDVGIIQRAPKRLTAQMVDPDGKITEFSWTENQQAIVNEIENFTIEGSAVEIEADPEEREEAPQQHRTLLRFPKRRA